MLHGYDRLLSAIGRFRKHEISFHEFASWVRSSGSGLGYQLEFKGDWGIKLDNWLEYIEFGYFESEWHELGCSLADFLEDAVLNERRPLQLPVNDRVIREKFRRD